MNWQQMAVAVLVGAVIGYSTNWIAIRMLFRPLYEKKIFGVHVPFTPGVIPRGKKRLAESIGNVVGGMLLTEEKIVQHLLRPEVEEQMQKHLSAKLLELSNREASVGEVLGGSGREFQQEISKTLSKMIDNFLCSKEFRQYLSCLAANTTAYLLDRPVGTSIQIAGISPGENVEKLLQNVINGDDFQHKTQEYLSHKIQHFLNSSEKIGNYLPEAMQEGIHQFIDDQAPRIISAIEQYLNSPPAQRAMKKRIEKFIEGTALKRLLNGMFQLFGNAPDMLVQRLALEISQFFADERNRAEFIERLRMLVDEALEKSVKEVADALDDEAKKEKADEIAVWLVEKLQESNLPVVLVNGFQETLSKNPDRTWREVLHLQDDDLIEKLAIYFNGLLERLLEREDVITNVRSMVHRETGRIWDLKINQIINLLPSDIKSEPGLAAVGLYRYLVREQVPGLMRFVNISGMVRRRVEELDVIEVEELLLGIMRRELVAITWLGALLGAFLGMVTVAMQHTMK